MSLDDVMEKGFGICILCIVVGILVCLLGFVITSEVLTTVGLGILGVSFVILILGFLIFLALDCLL